MTSRTLAVVSAGLGQPSSTRLLADQLAAAARDELAAAAPLWNCAWSSCASTPTTW